MKDIFVSKAKSLYGRVVDTIRYFTGKKVDYDLSYGNQCVDYARAYANSIGHPISTFGGSAINGWKSGVPFLNTRWKRGTYTGVEVAPKGSIVFFAPTRSNSYGHVAVVTNATIEKLTVSEQNAGSGNGNGIGSNAITTRTYSYKKAPIGDCVGWYYLD